MINNPYLSPSCIQLAGLLVLGASFQELIKRLFRPLADGLEELS